jgi:DNA-directed RNA polymerase specialized sigma24 family protein
MCYYVRSGERGRAALACRKRQTAWKRAWKRAVASTRGVLLAIVGVSLLTLGILLRNDELGQTVLVLGVAVLSLGILLPLVGEFVLGPGGLTFKQAFRERDAQFRPLVLAESEQSSLQRFARLLTGDADRAPAVVEEALARTYRVWTDIPPQELDLHVLCALVRVALGASRLRLMPAAGSPAVRASSEPALEPEALPSQPEVASAADISSPLTASSSDLETRTARSLSALSIDLRAVLLLRHIRDLDEPEIAWILDRPLGTVAETLHRAEDALEDIVGATSAGPA